MAPQAFDKEVWYLSHPKKPNKIRVVFDSSADVHGLSLNNVLLKGPDLTNSLLGVLMNIRKEDVAVTCFVQKMLNNFRVRKEDRDYLCFIWYKNIIDYRMTVHVFRNSPSPAIATLGLRQAVADASPVVKEFVHNHFYVDDGLISCQSTEEAVRLIKESQSVSEDSGLRLPTQNIFTRKRFFSPSLAKI